MGDLLNGKSLKILVSCHKKSFFESDDVFLPIHVGKAISDVSLGEMQGDNTGDNISHKNNSYCELTGLYWAWKNLKNVDYIGFCHYRRYFDFADKKKLMRSVSLEEYKINKKKRLLPTIKELEKYDILLPVNYNYRYSLFFNYALAHVSNDMKILKAVINDLYPEYNKAFRKIIYKNNKQHPFNMLICNWTLFDKYCNWLFPILSEMEKRIDISNYNEVQTRIYGYMGERLLNVFVAHHQLKIKKNSVFYLSDNSNVTVVLQSRLTRFFRNFSFFLSKL